MSKRSGNTISNQLILSVEDSPAKISVTRGNKRESKSELEAASGLNMPASFGSYDLNTSLWRMSQTSSKMESDESSGIWPKSGMMQNGRVYERPMWVPRTAGSASSLLLTPIQEDCHTSSLRRGYIRSKPHSLGSLSEQLIVTYGLRPSAAFFEMMMGYPENWTNVD